jgi:two-component system cell cycle response regulator DivK
MMMNEPNDGRMNPTGDAPGAPRGASRAQRSKPLILLVDDYVDTLELTAEFLQFKGYDVVTAQDGGAALSEAQQRLPDVVLLDLSLPVVDGLEVMRRLRKDPATRALRLVAFTAHAAETKADEAREAGCDGFITKPVAPDEMVKEIERQLQQARALQQRAP